MGKVEKYQSEPYFASFNPFISYLISYSFIAYFLSFDFRLKFDNTTVRVKIENDTSNLQRKTYFEIATHSLN